MHKFIESSSFLPTAGDDRRILLWNFGESVCDTMNKGPAVMEAEHSSNVFCLALNSNSTQIFSGGNDEQVIIHDTLR